MSEAEVTVRARKNYHDTIFGERVLAGKTFVVKKSRALVLVKAGVADIIEIAKEETIKKVTKISNKKKNGKSSGSKSKK